MIFLVFYFSPATYSRSRLYIGQNGKNADKKRKGNIEMNVKKLMTLALSAVMVLSLAACGQSEKTDAESNVQIPNPFADCETLEEAIGITGFDMVIPEAMEGYDRPTFQVMSGTMIQVVYRNDADGSVSIRKALGSDDISGDYNEYAQNRTVSVGELKVSVKGEQDLVHLATWTNSGYTYAVSVSSGLSDAAMAELVAEIR